MLQRLNELLSTALLGEISRLLQLAVLLTETRVKLRQLNFHIILDQLLLVADDLENLVFKL